MFTLDKFLQCVTENAARVREYELGHDGSDGKCDCIGLIIGALGLAGFRWPGTHGSNWAARNAMSTLEFIPEADDLFLGEIVYKAKEPGEEGYKLPDKYKNSGDLRDYYHVGVVTSVDPLNIKHCTSVPGGIANDVKIGKWRYGGKLKYVDYDEGGETMDGYSAIVTADNGKPVNLRKEPSTKSTILARVPVGAEVTVTGETDGGWDHVAYNGKIGYMMGKYLWPADETPDDADGDTVAVSRVELETWADVLEEMLRDIREKLGQG